MIYIFRIDFEFNRLTVFSKLKGVNPPVGLDEEVWQFREELPLHLINYLRDSTAK